MKLHSQTNSSKTEMVQDELKHSAPILSSTHSKGIHLMFPWGLWGKGYYQQVSEDASDASALACVCRQTFSGHKSKYLNFTADVDNALLFLHSKIY